MTNNKINDSIIIKTADALDTASENVNVSEQASKAEKSEKVKTEKKSTAKKSKLKSTNAADKKKEKSEEVKTEKKSKLKPVSTDKKSTVDNKKSAAKDKKKEKPVELFPNSFTVNGVKLTKVNFEEADTLPKLYYLVKLFNEVNHNENLKLVYAEHWNKQQIKKFYDPTKTYNLPKNAEFPQNIDLLAIHALTLNRIRQFNATSLYTDLPVKLPFDIVNNFAEGKNYFIYNDCEFTFYLADFSAVANKEFIDIFPAEK